MQRTVSSACLASFRASSTMSTLAQEGMTDQQQKAPASAGLSMLSPADNLPRASKMYISQSPMSDTAALSVPKILHARSSKGPACTPQTVRCQPSIRQPRVHEQALQDVPGWVLLYRESYGSPIVTGRITCNLTRYA